MGTSVETEQTIEQASEFCKLKFSSETSEFLACLNLISIPYSWDRAELQASERVWQPKFLSEPSEFRAKFRLVSTLVGTPNCKYWKEQPLSGVLSTVVINKRPYKWFCEPLRWKSDIDLFFLSSFFTPCRNFYYIFL